ncbi:LppX_LprAFG lipoprotein [Streptomyces phaeoluteigriseus]
MRFTVGVLGLSALLVTGCAAASQDAAGGGDTEAAATAVARAARKTEQVGSLRYRMTGRMPEEGRLRAEAAMAVKPPAMSLRTTILGGPGKGEGEVRLVDGVVYVGSDEATEDGKHWMKFGAPGSSDTPSGVKVDTAPMADKVRRNPALESTFLTAAEDLRKTGTETVDGVTTTHYEGTATIDEIRASYRDEAKSVRQLREQALAQYEKLGVDEMDMDVWIDESGRTKQQRFQGFGRKGQLDLTVTFLDFDKPVTVQAPPASDTVDLAEEMKKAGR